VVVVDKQNLALVPVARQAESGKLSRGECKLEWSFSKVSAVAIQCKKRTSRTGVVHQCLEQAEYICTLAAQHKALVTVGDCLTEQTDCK
jgi:hypothetical protein